MHVKNVVTYSGRNKPWTYKRPYIGKECGHTFSKPHHLKEHKSIHSEEMPFCCNLCQQSFRLKNSLKSHAECHRKFPACKIFSHTKFLEYHIVQQCKETIEQSGIAWKADSSIKNSELFSHEVVKLENGQLQSTGTVVEYKKERKEDILHCSLLIRIFRRENVRSFVHP